MSHLRRRLALFKIQPFRWYTISCAIAMLGFGLSYIAMTWLVLRNGASVGSVAILMICFWVPGVLIGPWAGVIVDRYSRKWMIFSVNTIRGLILIGFGWYLHHHFSVTAIYILALILGFFFTFYGPAAMRFIREMVEEKDLLYANATLDMAYEVGNIVGMGVAGLLMAWFSGSLVIALNGALFLVSSVCVMMVRNDSLHAPVDEVIPEKRSAMLEMKQGFKYLLSKKMLMVIYTVQLLILIEVMITPVLLAPFAKTVLHASAEQFGTIEAALSVGVVVGGLFIPWIADRLGLMQTILIMVIALGICFIVFSYNRLIDPAELLYFCIGFALAVWPLIMTKAQELTEITYQGRVQSTYNVLTGIIMIAVYLALKVSAHYINVASLYWVEVGITLAVIYLLFRYRKEMS